MELTEQEQEAIAHVLRCIRKDGSHNLNGCPIHCRALCAYRQTLIELAQKGYKFNDEELMKL